jgi:predicted kinase
VVLDTDVLKSALIAGGVPVASAGAPTYAAALALSRDLVAQGRSVILDSPCRYQELLDGGQAIAHDAGVRYGFIEYGLRRSPGYSSGLMDGRRAFPR